MSEARTPFPRPPIDAAARAAIFARFPIVEGVAPWELSQAQLLDRHWRHKSRRGRPPVCMAQLIRTTLWRLHDAIVAKQERGIGGNVRTLWYRYVKPTILRADPTDRRNSYRATLTELNRMAFEWRLFDYADFDFTDLFWESRRIGQTDPHIIVAAEKLTHVKLLRGLHRDLGITTVSWAGSPPGVTVENTAQDVLARMRTLRRTDQPLQLIALVDYDPAGYTIAEEFHRSLTQLGFDARLHMPIHPRELTQKELATHKLPLTRKHQSNKSRLANWIDETGAVAGDAFRIRIESIPQARRVELVTKLVTDLR